MTGNRTVTPCLPSVPPSRQGGARRALRRAWRECLIPIAAGDIQTVGALRAIAQSALTEWGVPAQKRADIAVALSELTTNALVHTDGPVRVRLARRGGAVRLDVADVDSVAVSAGAPDFHCDRPHGWGLAIVEALADRLTVTTHVTGSGKTVTAEFDLS